MTTAAKARKTWQDYVALAPHYLAIGSTEIILDRGGDKPWPIVDGVERGGIQRLDIFRDVRFTARHECGLTFTWWEDLEKSGSSGSSQYHIDVPKLRRLLRILPALARREFAAQLSGMSAAIIKNAAELERMASSERETARFLDTAMERAK